MNDASILTTQVRAGEWQAHRIVYGQGPTEAQAVADLLRKEQRAAKDALDAARAQADTA